MLAMLMFMLAKYKLVTVELVLDTKIRDNAFFTGILSHKQ